MPTSGLLPEMLACTLHMHDAVRCPGDTLAGSVILSIPTAESLALLHPDASAAAEPHPSQATPSAPSTPASRTIGTPTSSAAATESTALLPPSGAAAVAALSRPFEVELRLQLYGKVVVDGNKISLASIQRFRPVASAGNAAHMASFKLWSTRVVSLAIPADAGFPRVHEFRANLPDCLPPSFRGAALTCHYYLHVLALPPGGVGKKLLDLKLPFRVRVGDSHHSSGGGGGGLDAEGGMARTNLIEIPAGLVTSMQHCLMTPAAPLTPAKQLRSTDASAGANGTTQADSSAANSSDVESLHPDESAVLLNSSASPAVSNSPPHNGADAPFSLQRPNSNSTRNLPSPLHLVNSHSQAGVELSAALASASRRGSFSTAGGPSGSAGQSAASSPCGLPLSMLEQPLAPLTFNISKTVSTPSGDQSAHVVRLTLDQRFLRPGDTLRGHMDFSRAGIRCYRVAIALVQEEKVQEDCARQPGKEPFSMKKTFASFHQYTVNTLSTHFLFCLPLDVTANFQTDLTQVQWHLQFKFITDVDIMPKHSWSFLPAPSSTHAEALLWTLPLTVMPHDDADVVKQRSIKTMLISPQSFVP